MASLSAYDELKSWLDTEFGDDYAIYDWEQIEIALPQSDDSFIAIEEGEGYEDVVAMAGIRPAVQETAPFLVHLFFPLAAGFGPIRSLANQIATKGRQLQLSSGRDHAGRIRRIDPPVQGVVNDGLWTSMIVNIEYTKQHRPNLERVAP